MKRKSTHNLNAPFFCLWRKSRTSLLLCMLLLSTAIATQAQKVNWTSGYPKLDEVPLVMLEDERALLIRFTPLNADINNATIEITLPPQVDFGAISGTRVLTSTPLNISNTFGGALATGRTASIAITWKQITAQHGSRNSRQRKSRFVRNTRSSEFRHSG